MKSKLIMTVMAAASSLLAQATIDATAQQPDSQRNPTMASNNDFELLSQFATPRIDHLGRDVEIFSNVKKDRFFVQPTLVVRWDELKEQIDSPPQDEPFTLNVELWSDQLEKQILSELTKIAGKTIGMDQLSVVPHAFFVLHAKFGDRLEPIYSSQPLVSFAGSHGASTMRRTTIPDRVQIELDRPLSDIQSLYQRRNTTDPVTGTLYSVNHTLSSERFDVSFASNMLQESIRKLAGDERVEDQVVVSRSGDSSGFGLDFGFGKLGSQSSSQQAISSSTRRRFVNRKFLREFASQAVFENGGGYIGPDPEKAQKILDRVVDKFIAQIPVVSAAIELGEDGSLDVINYGKIEPDQAKIIFNTSGAMRSDWSNKLKGSKNGGKEGGENITLDYDSTHRMDDDTGINWSYDGNRWIPSTVDLYAVSGSLVQQTGALRWVNYIRSDKPQAVAYKMHACVPGAYTSFATQAADLTNRIKEVETALNTMSLELVDPKTSNELGVGKGPEAIALEPGYMIDTIFMFFHNTGAGAGKFAHKVQGRKLQLKFDYKGKQQRLATPRD